MELDVPGIERVCLHIQYIHRCQDRVPTKKIGEAVGLLMQRQSGIADRTRANADDTLWASQNNTEAETTVWLKL